MANLITWTSIELLHNVVRYLAELKVNTGALPKTVSYRGKVKLHGTNCAVQVRPEGVFVQGRTQMLTPQSDNLGFAKWVHARGLGNSAGDHETYFRTLGPDVTIFGEWCGPGVEPGMAISQAEDKVFAVFALQEGYGADAKVIVEPDEITAYLHGSAGRIPRNLHVLPWHGPEFRIDYTNQESLDAVPDLLNPLVAQVEAEDPWVKATFGLSGIGEGLVFYPRAVEGDVLPTDPEGFAHLMFKAKGDLHRATRAKKAVQVNVEVVASVDEFVNLMVTDARLLQGVSAWGREKRNTGNFLAWVVADVQKESAAELEASGLSWSQVERAVQARAREWFLR